MTTTVIVRTHTWPVEITTTDQYGAQEPVEMMETVAPHGERTVYLTQTRSITFKEMPEPKGDDSAPAS